MPLLAPNPPDQAARSVQSKIAELAANPRLGIPALRNVTGQLQLTEPHQVFILGLDDLVAGRGLDAAKPTGWRYLIQQGDNVLASAETVRGGGVDTHVFAAFNEGRFVGSTAEAIRTARRLPELQTAKFELRLLQVPALHVMAVWLHSGTGTGDLLVPLAPSPLDTPAGGPVPAARLLTELVAKARALGSSEHDDRIGA
jgi:hypothetical protein